MPKLPVLTGRELIKVLENMGFQQIRQRGDHVFLRHTDGKTTTVPVHSGEPIDRGLLNKIIKRDLQMTREEFEKYL